MNALSIAVFLIGLLFIHLFLLEDQQSLRTEQANSAYALSFTLYRNAVNSYAFTHKTPGSISPHVLSLPQGLKLKNWKNQVVQEANSLRCYVYGDASNEEIDAVIRYLGGSQSIGQNNKGLLIRRGSSLRLPSFIPDGSLVSVITLE